MIIYSKQLGLWKWPSVHNIHDCEDLVQLCIIHTQGLFFYLLTWPHSCIATITYEKKGTSRKQQLKISKNLVQCIFIKSYLQLCTAWSCFSSNYLPTCLHHATSCHHWRLYRRGYWTREGHTQSPSLVLWYIGPSLLLKRDYNFGWQISHDFNTATTKHVISENVNPTMFLLSW